MTKIDLINEISAKTGISKAEVKVMVEATMAAIKTSLISGNNVYLRGFGTFLIKRRATKVGRIITRNQQIIVPAHNIPAFKPVKAFALRVHATPLKPVKPKRVLKKREQ